MRGIPEIMFLDDEINSLKELRLMLWEEEEGEGLISLFYWQFPRICKITSV